jgi:hypothetical protein
MTSTSYIGARATVTIGGYGAMMGSRSLSNPNTCSPCVLRLDTVLQQYHRDGRQNLHGNALNVGPEDRVFCF